MSDGGAARHRLDLWLKLVCVFRHRSDATDACSSGHVRLNGSRAKPASVVREGDLVEISGERERRLVVLGLPTHTVSKEEARTLYRDESPPPPPRMGPTVVRDRGTGRPTKRDRREMERVNRKL